MSQQNRKEEDEDLQCHPFPEDMKTQSQEAQKTYFLARPEKEKQRMLWVAKLISEKTKKSDEETYFFLKKLELTMTYHDGDSPSPSCYHCIGCSSFLGQEGMMTEYGWKICQNCLNFQ
jgi:hypothetical protein